MQKIAYTEPSSNAGKPTETAKRLGQVFTPRKIADQMVIELSQMIDQWEGVTVMDPCIGEAALPKALIRAGITGFTLKSCELDPRLVSIAETWIADELSGENKVVCSDFLKLDPEIIGSWDVAIANPPYIRQEWIECKADYQVMAKQRYDVLIPGSSNLYVHFIVKLIQGLCRGGVFAVIVYDSWSHTRYGRWLVDFLNANCCELKSIPVRDTPFDGHLIDATILVGRRSHKQNNSETALEHTKRSVHHGLPGFVPLHSEYWTKRGLRLKQASFFMGNDSDILANGATSFVKKPSKLSGMSVQINHCESALLIPLNGATNSQVHTALQRRMVHAQNDPENNQSILNWLEKRPEYWDRHPVAPQAPILFNYYFRARPRHIYNPHEIHYADNFYGVRPTNGLPDAAVFAILNSTSVVVELQKCSRRQGNGLQKLQLFEYREAWIPGAAMFNADQVAKLNFLGLELAAETKINNELVAQIDSVVYEATGHSADFEPNYLESRAALYWNSK